MGDAGRLRVLALVVTAWGCNEASPDLLVDLRTDLVPGVEFVGVRSTLDALPPRDTVAVEGSDYSDGGRIAEFPDLAGGDHRLHVELLSSTGDVVADRRISFSISEDLGLTVVVSRVCRGVRCDPTQTCVSGACADISCLTVGGPSCPPTECSVDADCSSTSSCAVGECAESGECLAPGDDGLCASDEYCHPDDGCTTRPTASDASMDAALDADGGVDASMDAAGDGDAAMDADASDDARCGPSVPTGNRYVSASRGVTAGDGTFDRPWLTLQEAADAVVPGDVVIVEDGDYAGFVLSESGVSLDPIVFVAANRHQARIVDGSAMGPAIQLLGTSFVMITGFHITGSSFQGIDHRGATASSPSQRVAVRGNLIENTSRDAIHLAHAANCIVEGNEITDAGLSDSAIHLANSGTDGCLVSDNVIADAGGTTNAIFVEADLAEGGEGIISGTRIERNVIRGARDGLTLDGVVDTLIQNNLVVGFTRSALRAFEGGGATGPRNLIVVNNTFVGSSAANCILLTDDVVGNLSFNNILLGASFSMELAPTTLRSANNVVVDAFLVDGGNTTLAAFQAGGWDTGSNVDTIAATFDAAPSSYVPAAGAWAVDDGLAMFMGRSAPSEDVLSAPRPAGARIDVGAYERGAVPLCPP